METDDLIYISDYLAGELSEEEKSEVEQRLQSDQAFEELFRQQQEQIQILRALGRAETKAVVKDQFEKYSKQRTLTRRLWMVSTIAAAVLVLVLLRFAPWKSGPDSQQLALNYLEPFPASMERGEASPAKVLEDSAFQFYRRGDFEAALPLFQKLQYSFSTNPQYDMYLAECLSQTGQYTEAIALYKPLAENSPYFDAAQWNLALTMFLSGKRVEAIALLQKIRDGDHHKAVQAGDLLKQIGKE